MALRISPVVLQSSEVEGRPAIGCGIVRRLFQMPCGAARAVAGDILLVPLDPRL